MKHQVKRLAAKAMIWAGLSQGSTQIFRFAVTIILARLLLPQDFGLLGMATIFIGLISTVNELGLSAAIIQRKELTEKHLSTAFWTSLTAGILLCLTTIAIAPYVADFYNERRIYDLLVSLSVVFVIGSLGIVPSALLAKSMNFKKIAFAEVGSEFSSGLVAVGLAFAGFGVWSLVWRTLMGNIIIVAAYWKISPWRPTLCFDKKSFIELFRFGGNVMGSNIVRYAGGNVDNLIIGKTLGPSPLGYYALAYQMVSFPVTRISSVVSRVTFPAFSIIQEDNAKMRAGYAKVVRYISLITFPLIAGLFAVSSLFVPLVLGSRWTPMILPLQILCIAGLIQSVGSPVSSIFRSKGRSDIEFKWNLLSLSVVTLAILAGLNYGIAGVAFAVSATIVCLGWILQWLANRLIGLTFKDCFRAVYPATVSSIIMLASIGIVEKALPSTTDNTFLLIVSIAVGTIVYAAAIRVFFYANVNELITILKCAVSSKKKDVEEIK